MDILKIIKELSLEDLEKFVAERIIELESKSKKVEKLGFDLDYNPTPVNLLDPEDLDIYVDVELYHHGYIPKNTQIVYGMYADTKRGTIQNNGLYYYIDDDSYILDFCKYIKDKNIENEVSLFRLILEFITNYFGVIVIKQIDRDDMLKMIYKNETSFYDRIEESKFSWYKGKGNAMCSERAILVENILSFLGFDIYFILGKIEIDDEEISHSYNILNVDNADIDSLKSKTEILDFSDLVYEHADNSDMVQSVMPFIGCIDEDIEDIIDILYEGGKLCANEYDLVKFGDKAIQRTKDKRRVYSMQFKFI